MKLMRVTSSTTALHLYPWKKLKRDVKNYLMQVKMCKTFQLNTNYHTKGKQIEQNEGDVLLKLQKKIA